MFSHEIASPWIIDEPNTTGANMFHAQIAQQQRMHIQRIYVYIYMCVCVKCMKPHQGASCLGGGWGRVGKVGSVWGDGFGG